MTALGDHLRESRVPGTDGARARKLTVKLYGKGVHAKNEIRPGSASTKYYRRSAGQFVYSKLDFLNGAFGVIPDELDGYETTLDLPTFDIADSIDRDWLLYLVSRPGFYRSHVGRAKGSRKARRVGPAQLLAIEVPTPPLPEQRKIAAVLSSVDELIERTQAVIEQLQVVKKAMMQELLTRGLPGHHTRFKQTEIGEIPEEWEVRRVSEVGDVKLGRMRSHRLTEGRPRPYLRVANVMDGYIDTTDVLEMPFTDAAYESYQLVLGDVLLNEGQSTHLVGRAAMYRGDPPDSAFQKTLLRFRPSAAIDPEFALCVFRWFQQSGRFAEVAVQTTSMAHLTAVRFEAMRVPVPAIEEQLNLAGALSDFDRGIETHQHELSAIRVLKQALMSTLLTGQLRVTPDEEAAA